MEGCPRSSGFNTLSKMEGRGKGVLPLGKCDQNYFQRCTWNAHVQVSVTFWNGMKRGKAKDASIDLLWAKSIQHRRAYKSTTRSLTGMNRGKKNKTKHHARCAGSGSKFTIYWPELLTWGNLEASIIDSRSSPAFPPTSLTGSSLSFNKDHIWFLSEPSHFVYRLTHTLVSNSEDL